MAKSSPLSTRAKGTRTAADTIKDDYPEPYPGSPAFGLRAKGRQDRLNRRNKVGGMIKQATDRVTARKKRDAEIDKEAY